MNSDLQRRVRRVLDEKPIAVAKQVALPLVTFRMWCSVTGKPFEVVAEVQDNTLRLLRNVLPGDSSAEGAAGSRSGALGSFGIADGGWEGCPHCGAKYNRRKAVNLLWACQKKGCGNPLHCAGDRGGLFRCACGIASDHEFESVPAFDVRCTKAGGNAATSNAAPRNLQLPRLTRAKTLLTDRRK